LRSSTGTSGTPRWISAGSSSPVMKSDAKKSGLTSSNATSARAIAASISGRHVRLAAIDVSLHTSIPRSRTSGLSITSKRRSHSASWRQ
jgi:hypothetical protein